MDAEPTNGPAALPSAFPVAPTAARLFGLLAEAGVSVMAKVETARRHKLLLSCEPRVEVLAWEDDAGRCWVGYDPSTTPERLASLVREAAGVAAD